MRKTFLSGLFFCICIGSAPGPLSGQSIDIFMDDSVSFPGASAHSVEVLADSDFNIRAFAFGVDIDGDVLSVVEVTGVGTDFEDADFFAPVLDDGPEPFGSWWTLGVILDILDSTPTVPAGDGLVLACARYDVEPDAAIGTVTDLEISGSLGDPPVAIQFITDVGYVTPTTTDGTVTLEASFIRGDGDGDGTFNALVDALYLLAFQFTGGPPPPCLEASDADGDATFSGLVDAVYLLLHQFSGGPPPGAPYPACGIDPNPGTSLGCAVSGCP